MKRKFCTNCLTTCDEYTTVSIAWSEPEYVRRFHFCMTDACQQEAAGLALATSGGPLVSEKS